jgi:N-acetylglucosaminyl-diphospho-decaprenol L-rhamnosyltransferase
MTTVHADSDMLIELSIIIINYNSCKTTLECLSSLFAHPPNVRFEVIMLDNASSDGSVAAFRAAWPQIDVIDSAINTGFAGGNNIAAKRAVGRRLLLLNPDTIVLEQSFSALWAFAERTPGRQIWGGRTLFRDLSLNPTSCWAKMNVWSLFCSASGLIWLFPKSALFNREAYGGWLRDSERDVDIVTGCFLLIDHSLWRTLGGFDPTFFMYAEEADLCLRAKTRGARPGTSPEAEIIHLGGTSETSLTEKMIKIMRGRATLMRKHWSPLSIAIGLVLLRLWALSRLVGSNFLSGPRDEPGKAHEKWRTIWKRRSEWIAGY